MRSMHAQAQQAADGPSGGVINVQLSAEEAYADITPVRAVGEKSALVSVMRGCNNMCAFCIVPFTRGKGCRGTAFVHGG